MSKNDSLSIIIPARNEQFLNNTIQDILKNIEANTEIVVVLDGQWPVDPIPNHPKVKVLFFPESIGQRAATNRGVRISDAKYVMKLDAHCSFGKGFDRILLEDIKDDWTIVPLMRNLHVFDWVCECGHRIYQGPTPKKCEKCEGTMTKEILWRAKPSPRSTSYRFDNTLHFQYWGEYKKQQKGDLVETMSLQGSCFMMLKDRYWDLNICDETFGSWGNQGTEVAIKSHTSGGKVIVDKRTWYAHMFRTQGLDFSFPYPISGKAVERARQGTRDLFLNDKWDKQIYPLSWLLEKFWPVPGWTDDDLRALKSHSSFTNLSSEKFGIFSIVPSVPSSMTNHASSVPVNRRGEKMPIFAMSLSGFSGSSPIPPKDIFGVRDKLEMRGVTTTSIITDVIKDRDGFSFVLGNGLNKPSINKTVNMVKPFINSYLTVSVTCTASPIPTPSGLVNFNLFKDSINDLERRIFNDKIIDVHNTSIPNNKEKVKGIVYYTDNRLNMKLARLCRQQIKQSGLPVTSVSLKPMNFGRNIVVKAEPSYKTMFEQILIGLKEANEDIIFLAEHDVLYHQSHFEFTPSNDHTFYYNGNYWMLRLKDGFAINYDVSPLSGLVAYREPLITHFEERIALIEEKGFGFYMGFEPMTHKRIKWKNWYDFKIFKPEFPNVDLAHDGNLTRKRWTQKKFIRKPKFWNEGDIHSIQGWDNLSQILN